MTLEDLTYAVPPEWRRRSVVAFIAPNDEPNPATVVLSCEALAEGETVHSLAEQQIFEVRELPGLRFLGHDVPRANAVEIAFEWMNDRGPVEQTSTFVENDGMVTNVTTICAKKNAQALLPVFARLRDAAIGRRVSDACPSRRAWKRRASLSSRCPGRAGAGSDGFAPT